MKVTGYSLKNALQRWTTERDMLAKHLEGAMWHFDEVPDIESITTKLNTAEDAVATLQTALQDYNLRAMVTIPMFERPVTLSYVIKRVGPAGRLEGIWRKACLDTGLDRGYDHKVQTRKTDEIQPTRTVDLSAAATRHKEAQRNATALRNAIAIGNGTEIDLALPEGLFD